MNPFYIRLNPIVGLVESHAKRYHVHVNPQREILESGPRAGPGSLGLCSCVGAPGWARILGVMFLRSGPGVGPDPWGYVLASGPRVGPGSLGLCSCAGAPGWVRILAVDMDMGNDGSGDILVGR